MNKDNPQKVKSWIAAEPSSSGLGLKDDVAYIQAGFPPGSASTTTSPSRPEGGRGRSHSGSSSSASLSAQEKEIAVALLDCLEPDSLWQLAWALTQQGLIDSAILMAGVPPPGAGEPSSNNRPWAPNPEATPFEHSQDIGAAVGAVTRGPPGQFASTPYAGPGWFPPNNTWGVGGIGDMDPVTWIALRSKGYDPSSQQPQRPQNAWHPPHQPMPMRSRLQPQQQQQQQQATTAAAAAAATTPTKSKKAKAKADKVDPSVETPAANNSNSNNSSSNNNNNNSSSTSSTSKDQKGVTTSEDNPNEEVSINAGSTGEAGGENTTTPPENATSTTLIIRNLPFDWDQRKCQEFINKDHGGEYDYLLWFPPKKSQRINISSYAFVNFLTPELAQRFSSKWHTKSLAEDPSNSISIAVAKVQGFAANYIQYNHLLDGGHETLCHPFFAEESVNSLSEEEQRQAVEEAEKLRSKKREAPKEGSTVVIRNLPISFSGLDGTQDWFDGEGFKGQYDFFAFIPSKKRGSKESNPVVGLAYAFVNLVSVEAAKECIEKLHNKIVEGSEPLNVVFANLQGYEVCAKHFGGLREPGGRIETWTSKESESGATKTDFQ